MIVMMMLIKPIPHIPSHLPYISIGMSHATPYFYEGLIFSSFSNGRLAAIRSTDGIQLWEKPISILKGSTELEKLDLKLCY